MDRKAPDPADVEALLARFLEARSERTARAYTVDLQSYADFTGRGAPAALAELLSGGQDVAGPLAMDFAVDLVRRSLSRSTVDRRLATLRSFSRDAYAARLGGWELG